MFRAPEWSIGERSLWALDVLCEEAFAIDASMAPLKLVGSTTYPRGPHLRQTTAADDRRGAASRADRFGQVMPLGWGWGLRMSSPARVCRAIDAVNEEGRPAVVMVHPWEIDPDPPRVRLPLRQQFAHYFRLERVCRASQLHIARRPLRPPVGDHIDGTPPSSPMIVRSIRAVVVALLLLLSVAAAVATGQTSGAPVQPPRIALEDSLDAPYEALSLIRRDAPSSFPIGVRLETALSKDSRTALDARLSEYATRGAAVWIALRAPGAREDVDAWQAELEALLQRHGRELQTVEILLDVQPTALADYIVRIGSTEIRSKHDGLLVALGGIRAASAVGVVHATARCVRRRARTARGRGRGGHGARGPRRS